MQQKSLYKNKIFLYCIIKLNCTCFLLNLKLNVWKKVLKLSDFISEKQKLLVTIHKAPILGLMLQSSG